MRFVSALTCLILCSNVEGTWLEDPSLGEYANPEYVACCDCSGYWIDAEYLYWQTKASPRVIPLVFTGIFDENVTPTLETAGTSIVLGNKPTRKNGHSGIKFSSGYSFGCPFLWDMEISYTLFAKRIHSKSVQSNDFILNGVHTDAFPDNSFLAVPFFDVMENAESSSYIAKPGSFAGKATLRTRHWLQGVEWNFTNYLPCTCFDCFTVQGLLGIRVWNFNDRLKFSTSSPSTEEPNVFLTKDKFETRNFFYGAQAGLIFGYKDDFFSFALKAKVALGGMHERLKIKGKLQTDNFSFNGDVQTFPGGYFALGTNIGFYDQWKFGCLPEVDFNMGFKVCECAVINAGFGFLYVNKLLWAENQLNPRINTSQAPAITKQFPNGLSGIPEPKAPLKSKDFWMYGLNVGLELFF